MFSRMFRAIRLDSSVFEEVEHDQTAMGQAIGVVVIASILWSFWGLFALGVTGLIGAILSTLFGWFVWSFITYLVGTKLFGGTADMGEMLRALGFAYAPLALGIIPLLGHLAGFVLFIVAGVLAVRQALDFTTGKAVGTVLVGFVAWLVFQVVLRMLMAMVGLGGSAA